ncbi:MarR family winged helix-turn-helix transcriptional regulator [Komagataeibacter rhaeticus]|uniref:MarR family winged helix-turn-helix transcriptional regulator n=1 Tax=Komagataeibacter rhaeticus TaxID=215221 RepID=UPI0004D9433E|nr:MarR family transcriptional regulator [Komagataeibacter rhaeticus]KDU97317.1 MarR family transcriptional regulator [Komagataeibacter rhaeticus AF1]MBL7239814.1 MarR family transcriptional regulator [Komagataeibacter rhaeticus]MDT8870111.1 MarR family transcriptional regulator [Komagataeibacter rhaeticus]
MSMTGRSPLPDIKGAGFEDMRMTFLTMRLANTWRLVLDRALRAEGMSMAMMRPLAYLMMLPDGISQRTLAQSMNTDSSALVRVLDLLEGEGLVERHPDHDDRRAKNLVLTARGRRKCETFHATCAAMEARVLRGQPPEHVQAMMRVLAGVLGRAEAVMEEGDATPCAGQAL